MMAALQHLWTNLKTTEKNKLRLTKQSQTALQAGAVPVIMQPPWGEHFGIA